MRQEEIPITRELIKIKQRKTAQNLGISKFRTSMGWCIVMFQNGGISASMRLLWFMLHFLNFIRSFLKIPMGNRKLPYIWSYLIIRLT